MKEFRVKTVDFNDEMYQYVTIDCEDFDTKEEALEYAKTVKQTRDSRTIVTGDYGYQRIATITRRGLKEE